MTYKGKPLKPPDEDREKYLLDKLTQIRRTCEWLAGLGVAAVLGQVLRQAPADAINRRIPIVVGSVQVAVSIVGAMPWHKEVDAAHRETYLANRLKLRLTALFVGLGLFLVSVGFLLFVLW